MRQVLNISYVWRTDSYTYPPYVIINICSYAQKRVLQNIPSRSRRAICYCKSRYDQPFKDELCWVLYKDLGRTAQ
jgi:hypothetical protein